MKTQRPEGGVGGAGWGTRLLVQGAGWAPTAGRPKAVTPLPLTLVFPGTPRGADGAPRRFSTDINRAALFYLADKPSFEFGVSF